MVDYILPIMFVLFAAFSLSLSKSQKNYKKLVESNGEDFAKQVNKYLKLGGYLLLACSGIWLGFNLLVKF